MKPCELCCLVKQSHTSSLPHIFMAGKERNMRPRFCLFLTDPISLGPTFTLESWWVCCLIFKLVRLSCIQSDRSDTTVHVYGSWFCPWFPSVDRRYISQCCSTWVKANSPIGTQCRPLWKTPDSLLLMTPEGRIWWTSCDWLRICLVFDLKQIFPCVA